MGSSILASLSEAGGNDPFIKTAYRHREYTILLGLRVKMTVTDGHLTNLKTGEW
jgi:hypothetical protein